MTKIYTYITFLFAISLFSINALYAQVSNAPRVSGLILEKSTGKRLDDVNVINMRTNTKAVTNSFGVFYLEAAAGDSLYFSKTGYNSLKTVLYGTDDILLEMQPGLSIEEVVVTRRTREQEMSDILEDYRKKGVYNGGKNSVGTYLNSPATAIYNLFGRDAKNMKRFQKFMDQESEALVVDRIFSKKIVTGITALEGEELQNFMILYRPAYAVASSWGEYELLNYITKSFKTWNDDGRPAPQKLPKLEIPPQN